MLLKPPNARVRRAVGSFVVGLALAAGVRAARAKCMTSAELRQPLVQAGSTGAADLPERGTLAVRDMGDGFQIEVRLPESDGTETIDQLRLVAAGSEELP